MPPPRDPQPPGSGGVDPRLTPRSGASQSGSPASQAPSEASGERRRRIPFLGKGKQRAQAAAAETQRQAERDRLRQRLALRQAYRQAGGDPEGRGTDFRRWAEGQAAAEARARGEDPGTVSAAQAQTPEPPPQSPWPAGGPQPWGYPAPGPWSHAQGAYPGSAQPVAGAPVWGAQAVWGAPAPQASFGAQPAAPGPGPAAPPSFDPSSVPPPPAGGGWGAPPPPPAPPAPPGHGHGGGPAAPMPRPAGHRSGFGPPLGRACEIELGADARGVVIQGTLEQVTNDWITVRDHFATLHWVARSQVIEIRLR